MILSSRLSLAIVLALGAAACSSPTAAKDQFTPKTPTVKAEHRTDGSVNDHSLCDWKNTVDLRKIYCIFQPKAVAAKSEAAE